MEIFSNKEIAEGIYLLLKNKNTDDLSDIIEKVAFLDKKRLSGKSEATISVLRKILYKQDGIIEAELFSATPLEDVYKKEIMIELKKRYNANEIIFKEYIEKELLGGFKIKINNESIDLTLRNKINQLQEHLIKEI